MLVLCRPAPRCPLRKLGRNLFWREPYAPHAHVWPGNRSGGRPQPRRVRNARTPVLPTPRRHAGSRHLRTAWLEEGRGHIPAGRRGALAKPRACQNILLGDGCASSRHRAFVICYRHHAHHRARRPGGHPSPGVDCCWRHRCNRMRNRQSRPYPHCGLRATPAHSHRRSACHGALHVPRRQSRRANHRRLHALLHCWRHRARYGKRHFQRSRIPSRPSVFHHHRNLLPDCRPRPGPRKPAFGHLDIPFWHRHGTHGGLRRVYRCQRLPPCAAPQLHRHVRRGPAQPHGR